MAEDATTASARVSRLRALAFGLSRELWVVEAGIFLNMLGYGAVLPFEVIYLHEGRGFSLGVAGLVVGTVTGLAVVAAPVAGPVIDRFGSRTTAAGAGLALAAGYAGLAFAHTPAQAFVAAAAAGAGHGLGGARGGIVAAHGLNGLVALFVANALSYVVYVAILVVAVRDDA